MASFSIAELDQAAELVHRVVPPTPQYAWPKLSRRVGCTVWVKHENHTPTGAFKVRGGVVYLDRLIRAQPPVPGVITATRGNHGQSVAFAAARARIAATIYVPRGNSPDQNSAISAFGATVVEFGKDFDESKHEAQRIAAAQGLHFIPSFHRDLVVGVASYAVELFRAVSDLDAVYVGVGMGSGICGLITVRDLLGLTTEIIGVGAANAPATALSFAAGTVPFAVNRCADRRIRLLLYTTRNHPRSLGNGATAWGAAAMCGHRKNRVRLRTPRAVPTIPLPADSSAHPAA